MVEEKQKVQSEQNIVQEMIHRVELLKKTSYSLKGEERKIRARLIEQERTYAIEHEKIKQELEEMEELILTVKDNIKKTAALLKQSISKQQFQQVKDQVNQWKLEEYITKKELESTFAHFSQNQ